MQRCEHETVRKKWRGQNRQQTWYTIPEMISDNLLEGMRNDAEEEILTEESTAERETLKDT